MPQEFQVLRCFSCETFQVDSVKIRNVKWQCKLCGLKQSIKYIYEKSSSAKECRVHVQKLNSKRADISDLECDTNFAQQPEKLKESCNKSWGENEAQTVESNNSFDSMTSYKITTSRTDDTTRDNLLKTSRDNKEEKQTLSKWSKYLIAEEDDFN